MKKRLLAIALSLMVAVTLSSVSVFAALDANGQMPGKTVAVTKQLQVAQGVDVSGLPAFSFTVTKGAAECAAAATAEEGYVVPDATGSNYPDLAFPSIKFANGDRSVASDELLVRESSVDISGLSFSHAGLYAYTITEAAPTTTSGLTSNVNNKTYVLRVYVKNVAATGGGTTPQVDSVSVAPQNNPTNKIDATPDAGTPAEGTTAGTNDNTITDNDGNGFVFVNKYVKTISNHTDPADPTNPKSGAFVLTKTVLGDMGDKTYPFEFQVTVTLPSTAASTDIPSGYTNGTPKDVTLTDGQDVTFATLPAGTVIKVQETGKQNYKTTYNGAQTDATGAADTLANSTAAPTAPAANDPDLGNGMTEKTLVVGDAGAFIDVTNYYSDAAVSPTGIIINNLPYILLILIALGGIVLFARKRRYQ